MGAFKRSFFGYNRKQVDTATAACAEQRVTAERELLVLSEMLIARERELDTLRGQLADAHARHDRSLRSLEVLAGHLDELHAQARGQATRIRMKALDEAALVTERASEALQAVRHLQDVRQGAGDSARSVAGDVSTPSTVSGNGTPTGEAPGSVAGSVDTDAAGDRGPAAEIVDAWAGAAASAAAENGEVGFFHGDVEVEIGPLGDFSQLLGFESAAGTIAGASDISVRRFAAGRATLGMRLDEPIELLRELEERAPFEFKVRRTGGRRVVLDIDEQVTE